MKNECTTIRILLRILLSNAMHSKSLSKYTYQVKDVSRPAGILLPVPRFLDGIIFALGQNRNSQNQAPPHLLPPFSSCLLGRQRPSSICLSCSRSFLSLLPFKLKSGVEVVQVLVDAVAVSLLTGPALRIRLELKVFRCEGIAESCLVPVCVAGTTFPNIFWP